MFLFFSFYGFPYKLDCFRHFRIFQFLIGLYQLNPKSIWRWTRSQSLLSKIVFPTQRLTHLYQNSHFTWYTSLDSDLPCSYLLWLGLTCSFVPWLRFTIDRFYTSLNCPLVLAGHASGCWLYALGVGMPYNRRRKMGGKLFQLNLLFFFDI